MKIKILDEAKTIEKFSSQIQELERSIDLSIEIATVLHSNWEGKCLNRRIESFLNDLPQFEGKYSFRLEINRSRSKFIPTRYNLIVYQLESGGNKSLCFTLPVLTETYRYNSFKFNEVNYIQVSIDRLQKHKSFLPLLPGLIYRYNKHVEAIEKIVETEAQHFDASYLF